MPFQALRFVHAASLLVDHQLHDVGPVDEDLKPSLIDATLTAFERMVEVCVDQEVDFLLLTGDTFCESDRSLRARVALREGFEMLREAGIEVFVVPGPLDPPSAWQEFPELPDNVSLFVPATDEPTAVMREGHVVATIQACSQRTGIARPESNSDETPTLRTSPLRVSIMPPFESKGAEPDRLTIETLLQNQTTDYIAVPLPYSRLTAIHGERMAHCPGPATSVSREDEGICGCTLVAIDDEANITARHFATSPIRRETIDIEIADEMSWDELIATMREKIDSIEQLGAASVALLDWRFTGTGELAMQLDEEEAEAELFELLAADVTTLADLEVSHTLQISAMSDAQAEAAWQQQARRETAGGKGNPFVSGLFSRLDEATSIAHDVVEAEKENHEADSPWLRRLDEIVSRVSPKAVTAHARRHGTAWFQTESPAAEEAAVDWDEPVSMDGASTQEVSSPETVTPARQPPSIAETQMAATWDEDTHVNPPSPHLPPPEPPIAEAEDDEFGEGLEETDEEVADDYDEADYGDDDYEDDYDEYEAA